MVYDSPRLRPIRVPVSHRLRFPEMPLASDSDERDRNVIHSLCPGRSQTAKPAFREWTKAHGCVDENVIDALRAPRIERERNEVGMPMHAPSAALLACLSL